jgi:EAL domain-containing protein (putative c-di-GMP-specific phosphodiesterase class I)
VQRFDQDAYAALGRRNQTEADLRTAVHDDELRLHYQPIVDLTTGERYAVEALLRWDHPSRGLLTAGDFIDVAEDSSLIVDLGRWVVGRACRQLAEWDAALGPDAPQLLFINLSAAELTHPGVGRLVTSSAAIAGIDPSRLVLEITETGLLAEPGRAAAVSRTLRDLGCEVAIDDFGTGYSSLSRLVQLPARILKIDQSFVRGLVDNPDSVAVVSAVLLLAHNLRKLVVAEGVEDAGSLEVLREMGCRYAQGFHLARPAEVLL